MCLEESRLFVLLVIDTIVLSRGEKGNLFSFMLLTCVIYACMANTGGHR